jgi:hypothetical protein
MARGKGGRVRLGRGRDGVRENEERKERREKKKKVKGKKKTKKEIENKI